MAHGSEYKLWAEKQIERSIDLEWVRNQLKNFKIETPSWGYGDSGTRFKVFKQEGVPRNLEEKLEDAAQVHRYTGCCPSVAVHIPWDKCDNYQTVKKYAQSLGLTIGAVNPNLFQENHYKFGSVCNSVKTVRDQAIDHILECVEIARQVDSKIISLWFADGTNYPGQACLRERKHYMEEALLKVGKALAPDMRMLIEYKFFEPAFYHTDIADWGMAYTFAQKAGKQAEVLVDLGHHALGVNIEHIVAFLIDEHKLGGFHFNNKKYADDDLIVGTINPYELFLIFNEIISAALEQETAPVVDRIAYMIDQSHCIEPKIPAMIRSVMNVQTYFAKALLVNRHALKIARQNNDVLMAEAEVREAFETDVRPILASIREETGLTPDPMRSYLDSGFEKKKLERGIGGKGWD